MRVKDLLEQGAKPNTKDFAGWTPLVCYNVNDEYHFSMNFNQA